MKEDEAPTLTPRRRRLSGALSRSLLTTISRRHSLTSRASTLHRLEFDALLSARQAIESETLGHLSTAIEHYLNAAIVIENLCTGLRSRSESHNRRRLSNIGNATNSNFDTEDLTPKEELLALALAYRNRSAQLSSHLAAVSETKRKQNIEEKTKDEEPLDRSGDGQSNSGLVDRSDHSEQMPKTKSKEKRHEDTRSKELRGDKKNFNPSSSTTEGKNSSHVNPDGSKVKKSTAANANTHSKRQRPHRSTLLQSVTGRFPTFQSSRRSRNSLSNIPFEELTPPLFDSSHMNPPTVLNQNALTGKRNAIETMDSSALTLNSSLVPFWQLRRVASTITDVDTKWNDLDERNNDDDGAHDVHDGKQSLLPNEEDHKHSPLSILADHRFHTGGNLTPKVFIPVGVWRQDGAKIVGASQKLTAFLTISELLDCLGKNTSCSNTATNPNPYPNPNPKGTATVSNTGGKCPNSFDSLNYTRLYDTVSSSIQSLMSNRPIYFSLLSDGTSLQTYVHRKANETNLATFYNYLHEFYTGIAEVQNSLAMVFPSMNKKESTMLDENTSNGSYHPMGTTKGTTGLDGVSENNAIHHLGSGTGPLTRSEIPIENLSSRATMKGSSHLSSSQQSSEEELSTLGKVFKSIGRVVKKSATTAYQRLGTVVVNRLSEDELWNLALALVQTYEKSKFLVDWILYFERSSKLETELIQRRTTNANRNDVDDEYKKNKEEEGKSGLVGQLQSGHEITSGLKHWSDIILDMLYPIRNFFSQLMTRLVLKDLIFLTERYLRKTRKSFTRIPELDFEVDDFDEGHHD
eukprot:g1664.t1